MDCSEIPTAFPPEDKGAAGKSEGDKVDRETPVSIRQETILLLIGQDK